MNPKLDYAIKKRNEYITYLTKYTNKVYNSIIKDDLSFKDFKDRFDGELEKIIRCEDERKKSVFRD